MKTLGRDVSEVSKDLDRIDDAFLRRMEALEIERLDRHIEIVTGRSSGRRSSSISHSNALSREITTDAVHRGSRHRSGSPRDGYRSKRADSEERGRSHTRDIVYPSSTTNAHGYRRATDSHHKQFDASEVVHRSTSRPTDANMERVDYSRDSGKQYQRRARFSTTHEPPSQKAYPRTPLKSILKPPLLPAPSYVPYFNTPPDDGLDAQFDDKFGSPESSDEDLPGMSYTHHFNMSQPVLPNPSANRPFVENPIPFNAGLYGPNDLQNAYRSNDASHQLPLMHVPVMQMPVMQMPMMQLSPANHGFPMAQRNSTSHVDMRYIQGSTDPAPVYGAFPRASGSNPNGIWVRTD